MLRSTHLSCTKAHAPEDNIAAATAAHSLPSMMQFAPGSSASAERQPASEPAYSNQSKATVPSAAYMPITRPVNPPATSVDR